MAELTLRPDLVERLQSLARRENRPLDDVIETLLAQYSSDTLLRTQTEQEALLRQDRLHMYERARQYWQNTGDPRQDLTDEDLDELFWLFDQDDIPRLKVDQDSIQLPPDPWEKIFEIIDGDPPVAWDQRRAASEHTKEILNTEYTDYLLARLNRPAEPTGE